MTQSGVVSKVKTLVFVRPPPTPKGEYISLKANFAENSNHFLPDLIENLPNERDFLLILENHAAALVDHQDRPRQAFEERREYGLHVGECIHAENAIST